MPLGQGPQTTRPGVSHASYQISVAITTLAGRFKVLKVDSSNCLWDEGSAAVTTLAKRFK